MNSSPAPDANHLLQFWLILSLTFTTLTAIGTFIVMVSNRRQKREVSFSETPASKREFDSMVELNRNDHARFSLELKKDRDDNERHASLRSSKIYEELNDMRDKLLARIEEVNDTVTLYAKDTERALGRIEGKLDK